MPNRLSLAARYRNARAERVLFKDMPPALRCMALIAEYREVRDDLVCDDYETISWAENLLEYTAREFDAAREELRSAIRFNNAVEAA